MKKTFLSFLAFCAVMSAVHAQQTVVIQRPGIFTDLADAATALVTLPAAAAVGIVEGTVEAVRDIVTGHTTVITTSAPCVVRPQFVTAPVIVQPAPAVVHRKQVVVTPTIVSGTTSTTVVTTTPAPVAIPGAVVVQKPTTSIITDYGNGTMVTVTREASGYELGPNVVYPVDPEPRVGPSPFVNPYVYRHR